MKHQLKWMAEQKNSGSVATTFGLPWAKGQLDRNAPLYLQGEGGEIPMQSSNRAFWPDGSVKWTLQSAVVNGNDNLTLSDEKPQNAASQKSAAVISATQSSDITTVNTGSAVWTLQNDADDFIKSVIRPSGKVICSGGRLTMLNELRFQGDDYSGIKQVQPFRGIASQIVVEESGPVRAVVRVHGSHVAQPIPGQSFVSRKWLPFDLRLYFYAGKDDVRMVHTFIFDGRDDEDFIRGIGIEFDVPLRSALFNRYVRFGGESGLFCESPKSLWLRKMKDYEKYYADQLAGKAVVDDSQFMTNDMTEWNDYKLTQLSSAQYTISKRTQPGCVYVKGAVGDRSLGIAFAGDATGGMSVFKKDFWQKFPSSLEVKDMLKDTAKLIAWIYSPDGNPIAMTKYDTKTHLETCYEGFYENRSSGYGIANTNEIVVECYDGFPGNDQLVAKAEAWQNTNLLMAPLEYYLETKVLGDAYSIENRSTPEKAKVEGYLDGLLEHHKMQREQSDWYGFWDYGDIRHSYDKQRHSWMYDMGGYAWQNTELVPNLWLWYGFMRSGREDYFRWAEAMTRHNSEVDLYHLGPYRLLGSRHNVVHWGCGCKECRVGMAQLYKVFYYLTGDERIGDIMDDEKDVDFAVALHDPLRAYYSPNLDHSCHLRFGPDIIVILGNWLTRWERFEDTKYRDKIYNMLKYFPNKSDFAATTVWNYSPYTGEMTPLRRDAPSHFNYCFGTEYVMPELISVLEDADFERKYINMGLVFTKDGDPDGVHLEWESAEGRRPAPKGFMGTYFNAAAAYAAGKTGDDTLAQQVWEDLLRDEAHQQHDAVAVPIIERNIGGAGVHKQIKEAGYVTGNGTGQWGAHVIVAMAHIGDKIPK